MSDKLDGWNSLVNMNLKLSTSKGKENQVVDALSERAHEMHIVSISMYKNDMKDKIIEATNSNQHYLKTKETLQQKFKDFELKEDGFIMYRGIAYVPNSS
jgi:hypothetical protein